MLVSSIILFILTFLLLWTDKEISIYIMKSYIQRDEYTRKTTAFLLALIFPITLTHYLILKFKDKQIKMKKVLITLAVLLAGYVLTVSTISFTNQVIAFSNTEIDLKNQFERQKEERITFYSKIYVQLSQTSEIAIKNDSSFQNIVNTVMASQPQSLTGMLTAFQLIDPSVNYEQVSKFYAHLSDLANSNREGFFQQEKQLQSIAYTHKNLISQFPGSFYNMYFKRTQLKYTPILTDVANEVNKTNIESDIKVF